MTVRCVETRGWERGESDVHGSEPGDCHLLASPGRTSFLSPRPSSAKHLLRRVRGRDTAIGVKHLASGTWRLCNRCIVVCGAFHPHPSAHAHTAEHPAAPSKEGSSRSSFTGAGRGEDTGLQGHRQCGIC